MNILRLLMATRSSLPRVLELMRDVRVPLWLKVAAVGAAVFVISPLNVLGDIPFLGFFDDAALLLLIANQFVKFAGRHTS